MVAAGRLEFFSASVVDSCQPASEFQQKFNLLQNSLSKITAIKTDIKGSIFASRANFSAERDKLKAVPRNTDDNTVSTKTLLINIMWEKGEHSFCSASPCCKLLKVLKAEEVQSVGELPRL